MATKKHIQNSIVAVMATILPITETTDDIIKRLSEIQISATRLKCIQLFLSRLMVFVAMRDELMGGAPVAVDDPIFECVNDVFTELRSDDAFLDYASLLPCGVSGRELVMDLVKLMERPVFAGAIIQVLFSKSRELSNHMMDNGEAVFSSARCIKNMINY